MLHIFRVYRILLNHVAKTFSLLANLCIYLCRCLHSNLYNINNYFHRQRGTSVLELVVVLGTSSALLGVAVSNYGTLNNPMQNSANQTAGFFKQVRAKAISSTSAYRIEQLSDLTLITKNAPSCDSPQSEFFVDSDLTLEIEKEIRFATASFSLCFNARGFADANKTLPLITRSGTIDYANVVIPLGGGAKVVTY